MTNTEQAVGTTAVDASTQTVEASNGVAYAYRRFGTSSDGVPVVFLQHFRGNLDNWDPALVDGIASEREVILVDNVGVGASTGRVPSTVAEMARDALAFTDALGLRSFDLFGFSLGGFVAQELALLRPWAVRNLVLAGTGPKGAPAMHGWREDIERESRHDVPTPANLLYIFFAHSDSSRALGVEFLQRISARTEGRDAPTTPAVRDAQYDAVLEWGIPSIAALERLTAIRQPTLVLQGDDDLMIRTPGSHTLAGLIPNARLHIFPDAAHASIFQYPQEAAALVREFLSTTQA
ncbi:alpha/beta hydrolase [Curtobacterium flaccumfaciens]|uniref:alpha/beta fold hydrolase n=1 Tax=Curtobacterium TaxID=2034 RepID=UPI000DA85B03|nr:MULTISPECIES: alpha/beta hydrolase [Curtobacterium]MCS6558581.1 alpha/beta hydrolase [Curtobacterium flaccumfaciens]PZF28785.1 alpha/beta hydrolase [Curtobacterium sp. MCLR17_045]